MRSIVPLAVIVLAACTTNQQPAEAASDHGGPPQATAIHGVTPGHKCATPGTEKFIGAAGTSQAGAAIKRASKAAVLRWAPPGYMLTMDYREDRVTVYLGPDRKVTKISCG